MIAPRAVTPHAPGRAPALLLALLLLLIASALGPGAFSGAPGARTQTIVVGGLPTALALDPGSGRAVVADEEDATISVLDLATDQIVRTMTVGHPSAFAPLALAVDPQTHHLFVANRGDDGAPSVVRLFDSRSGVLLATVRVGAGAAALAVDEHTGHVVVANLGAGTTSLLDSRSGAVRRTTAVGLAPLAVAVDARTARAFVIGPAWTVYRSVPAWDDGGPAGLVAVLDTRTGALLRRTAVGSGSAALAVDARHNRVFVVNSSDGTVSMLDADTGLLLHTTILGGQPTALALDERRGRVFVVSGGDGLLHVLDARTGTLLQTRSLAPAASPLATPATLAVDAARDRVYVTMWGRLDRTGVFLGRGRLWVVDARDGAVRGTRAIGVAPQAVAVEAGRGRVVVVEGGGALRAAPDWVERWRGQIGAWLSWLPWWGRLAVRAPDVVEVPGAVRVIDTGA